MSDLYGFILTRHVNSVKTNNYWNHSVKLLRSLYPHRKIIIIDDNSNYDFVKAEFDYTNVELIQSEFQGRGELLPYYYFLKHKFFKNAVVIHDSVFFHKRIAFEKLNGMKVLPLWFFHPDKEDVENRKRIMRHLKNYQTLDSKLSNAKTNASYFCTVSKLSNNRISLKLNNLFDFKTRKFVHNMNIQFSLNPSKYNPHLIIRNSDKITFDLFVDVNGLFFNNITEYKTGMTDFNKKPFIRVSSLDGDFKDVFIPCSGALNE